MPLTWLLYFSPPLALMIGLLVFWMARRIRVPPPAPLSEADVKRLDELLR
jgi:cytochrome c-type biogenesis protein CcmH